MDKELREDLAAAYRITAGLGMDDHTYTHLSARPLGGDYFYILPFGLRFEEVTSQNLLRVSMEGEVLDGAEFQYNRTGFAIHGSIYKAREDINAVFHLHTPSNVAVSAMMEGLLPISQWALHFYDRVSYHEYNSLVVNMSERLVQDLGQNFVMFLNNHGSITSGRTIQEAMFYTYHLEQACKAQVLACSTNRELIIPSRIVCEKTVHDLLTFEQNLGERDWMAWKRIY